MPQAKSKDNLIHIKLDYSEAFDTKKDLLSLQMKLLKIAKKIREYNFYRNEEAELKSLLYKKAKGVRTDIGNLQKILPKADLPKILEKDKTKELEISSKSTRSPDKNIEDQLQEIQRRLSELQGKNI
ncbi:MAG: hypothetical protein WDZ69_02700 [Candidatus Pacearchaeota archaeon]